MPPLDVASGGGSLSPRRCCALLSESPGAPRDVASGRTGGAFTTCSARLALLVSAPPGTSPPECDMASAPEAFYAVGWGHFHY